MYDAKFDLNHDGVIDDADFAIFKSHFNEMAPYSSAEAAACDFDGSGKVDVSDWGWFAPHYGEKEPEPTPEPTPEKKTVSLWEFLPMPPEIGPPLPRFLGFYWPWYKKTEEV